MKAIHRTYLSLMVLLGLTVWASTVRMNLVFSEAVSLGIALAKSLFIGAVFMKLREESPSLRFMALLALVWVGILVAIVSSDYLTREIFGVLGK